MLLPFQYCLHLGLDARQSDMVVAGGQTEDPVRLQAGDGDRHDHGMVDRLPHPGPYKLAWGFGREVSEPGNMAIQSVQ
jgi:hypothetical protein